MRAIGFIGILALLVIAGMGLVLAVQAYDWKGIALMLFLVALLALFATALYRGWQLERKASSGQSLAAGWYGESVTSFFVNQVARSPEGIVLLVGSAASIVLAVVALIAPAAIGLGHSRAGASATLFFMWPMLAFVAYVRVCGPAFTSKPSTVVAMVCVMVAPIVMVYR